MAALAAFCTLAATLLAASINPAAAWGLGDWVDARATFYGRDAWSLHDGSCGFGFVCPNRWSDQLRSGYDLVALSDQSPLYNADGSACGQCLEIQCRSATIRDGFGATFDRTDMCKSGQQSVKVKVADTCECNYAENRLSNRRWCCGDYPHLDVSQWALDKIVQNSDKWGVFAIRYRTVSCNAQIANEAPNPTYLVPDPHAGDKPANLDCSTQGGVYTTQSKTTARASRSYAPSPKKSPSTPHKKGGYHSKKYWVRRKWLLAARGHHHSPRFWRLMNAYFARRGPNMEIIKQ